MKKLSAVLLIIFLLVNYSTLTTAAGELRYDYSAVYENLSDEASETLSALGVSGADVNALRNLSFESVMEQLAKTAGESMSTPLKGLLTVIAILLLCSMLSMYRGALSGEAGETLNTAAALCISAAVAAPAVSFIHSAGETVAHCANLFLAYIPIVTVMLAASGKAVSALTYQASVTAAGQGAARVFSDVIVPLLYVFLGLGITAGAAPQVRLGGLNALLARLTKWVLGFVMAVFTAVLSVRQGVASSLDTVASRTAKFALSSFVPMVGGALSEAYKTVQGSVSVLKSGLGIFVLLALAITFLPLLLQGFGWALCLFAGKTTAEFMGLDGCAALLEGLRTVFVTIIAVLLCLLAVFIICTAAALSAGSAS